MNTRALEERDVLQVAQWNVELHEDEGSTPMSVDGAAERIRRWISDGAFRGAIFIADGIPIGYALYEELQTEEGRILNPNFQDYKIPTIQEMDFPIDLDFIEIHDDFGPFGAKGIAEPGLVPTAPAIANAVYDAVGIRIRDLPITPEKVLSELKKLRP